METLTPSLPLFFSIYNTIYLFGYFLLFRNWKGSSRAEASSCLISLSHGTPAVILATSSLLVYFSKNTEFGIFASENTDLENMVLENSMAYFTTDLLHYFIFLPNDVVFIAHHLATLYVFITCRYIVNHGALGLLALLFLAEITSPCQNTWTLAGICCRREAPKAAKVVVDYLSPVFYLFYFVVRGILGPIFVCRMAFFYFSGGGKGLVPEWAWGSWILVIACAIFFSVLWILNLSYVWCKERTKKLK